MTDSPPHADPAPDGPDQGSDSFDLSLPERDDNAWNRLWDHIDDFQRRMRPLAFGFAVFKKFDDDRGGPHSALITYYSFFAIFPLLLVLVVVLGWVLDGNPELQQRIVDSAISRFPVIGDEIADNVGSLRGNGIALVIGVLFALWAGLGATHAAQDAINTVLGVPFLRRQNFWIRQIRGLSTLALLALIVLVGTALGSGTTWVRIGGDLGTVGYWAVTLLVNTVSVFALTNILCHRPVPWRKFWAGAAFGGISWTVLQYIGSIYVGRVVQGASQTYGLFAVVIGLLSWVYLQARLFLTASEVAVVAEGRLWPRALVRERPTGADVEVADLIAARDERIRATERHYRELRRRQLLAEQLRQLSEAEAEAEAEADTDASAGEEAESARGV
jgi:membrane protein